MLKKGRIKNEHKRKKGIVGKQGFNKRKEKSVFAGRE